jgi:hypothetical protein
MSKIYEDEYLKITDEQIEIKYYYFPCGAKKIHFSQIESFGRASEYGIDFFDGKAWGMGLSSVWWALGSVTRSNNMNEQLIIQVKNKGIKCGCSSKNIDEVLNLLREKAPDASSRLLG